MICFKKLGKMLFWKFKIWDWIYLEGGFLKIFGPSGQKICLVIGDIEFDLFLKCIHTLGQLARERESHLTGKSSF